ncbi:carboxypeptidase-like regulatory domain-containing protein [uncultured Paludibaculum sp.]|uniref:carboxypeptidase-like regulatory domain-containing protein n=1 Tax=uncultured Paludibaculum sp. TaxID=1765020 RepID=UPI002AAC17D7|nr:carboxypeptidase-like regulatory domain-containing protein [uncultured Paludibaculum sp.]
MRGLALAVALGTLAVAQYGPCSASGVVVQDGSGLPVARARLLFSEASRPGAMTLGYFTDDQGHFEAFGLDPANYSISIQKAGFVEVAQGQAPDGGAQVRLAGKCAVTGLEYLMAPAAVISGRLLDKDGQPLGITTVDAMRRRWMNGRWQFLKIASAMSDGEGRYRIARLPMGTYALRVHPPAPVTVRYGDIGGVAQVAAPAFYPGVYESSRAKVIQVNAPAEMGGYDFGPVLIQLLRVEGRVTGADGQGPPAQCRVSARPRESIDTREYEATYSPESGAFSLSEVPPGSYLLTAYAEESDRLWSAVLQLDLEGSDATGLHLALEPPSAVPGRVTLTSGARPVHGVWLKLKPSAPLAALDDDGPADADGNFQFNFVLHERYHLAAGSTEPNVYLKSAQADGKLVEGTLLDWTVKAPRRLEVVVGDDAGVVEGTVHTQAAQPVRGYYVVLVPADMSRLAGSELLTQPTQANGGFRISNVPPGDYYAYSFAFLVRDKTSDPAMLSDPLWVPGYRGQAATITVAPRGTARADLRPQPLP